ncbi:uncharacterized protein B0I36DRAFT_366662 [Microdochium trichocladiopsis]|uniref:FAD-binding PCMH-type domain-containing protein n=1 Tax=Microdochium trichocladiopsis TaxID=1682393 RepID=A0A9P9BPP0_9PEZI|nr:uncharacterized protein B0I36DRAFT_366662 [Microdochium trichocladiopsis]KAH7024746.1 hypothetical protein B0I36DRAFT_366662 [Microdochium trichocladiopsis]
MVSSVLAFLGVLAASTSAAAPPPPPNNAAAACRSLKSSFPQQVVSSADAAYPAWNGRWADTAELAPSCIFRPKTAKDVSAAVKVLNKEAGPAGDACPFSIKCGGHTPWAGANNVNNGVAIDLSGYMNTTTVSADKTIVSLGGGEVWRSAYAKTDGMGIAFPGGRCPGTGVGGVSLGGGYSWFQGSVGFVADNVINFEVVLASGEIVNANKTNHQDLFMALKGGNNNFGVVTRVDLATFQHSQQIHGGLIIVPVEASDAVLENLQRFTDDDAAGGVHTNAGLTVEYFLNATSGVGQILLWVIDTDAAGEHEAIRPFLEMQPQIVNRVATSSIAQYPSSVPAVTRVMMADLTFVNDLETLKGVHKITMQIFEESKGIPGLVWDFQFEPLSRHVIDQSVARGGNSLGINGTADDLLIMFIMPLWSDPAYDDQVYAAAQKWHSSVQAYTASMGKGHRFEFANYAAKFQNVMASYGPENLQFLRTVSRKYDPKQIFQRSVRGGYKLGV